MKNDRMIKITDRQVNKFVKVGKPDKKKLEEFNGERDKEDASSEKESECRSPGIRK
jgi:hypothetical protein